MTDGLIVLTRTHFEHMTRRTTLSDGSWVTVCACGWESRPAAHREMLGWVCGREREEKEGMRR